MIIYKYEEMHEKAQRIREELPNMLSLGERSNVASLVRIDPEIWSGQAAEKYAELCSVAVARMDEEMLRRLPDIIDASANDMQTREKELAALTADAARALEVLMYS